MLDRTALHRGAPNDRVFVRSRTDPARLRNDAIRRFVAKPPEAQGVGDMLLKTPSRRTKPWKSAAARWPRISAKKEKAS